MAAVGLCCHAWSFSCCSKQELLYLQWTGFSSQWLLLLQSTGSNTQALGCRLRSLLGLSCSIACGIKPTSPALAGGLLTPGSPGKAFSLVLMVDESTWSIHVFQVSICHHVNHEMCNLSSKEQRTVFTGHSGQHPPFTSWTYFSPVVWRQTDASWLQRIRCFVMESSPVKGNESHTFSLYWRSRIVEILPSYGEGSQGPSVPSFSNLLSRKCQDSLWSMCAGHSRISRFSQWQIVSKGHVSVCCFPHC